MIDAARAGRPGRLAALARDALLDHLTRNDPRHALALLVSALSQELGLACQVEAEPLRGMPGWTEGRREAGPLTTLELPPLGRLHVQGSHVAARLLHELEPVRPALVGLLQRVMQPEADASGGAHATLLREAMAGADTFVWEWFLDNDWLTDIDQGLSMLGYRVGEIGHTQDDWNALIHPDDREANHAAYLRHERDEVPFYDHAYRIRAANGEWRWMHERGRIVERHADGRPRRMVGTQTDITERRRLEAVGEQAAQAEAASRAKSEFLARMSHELRTPLNAVLGFAQLMEVDVQEPAAPGQLRRLKLIRDAGAHLLHMINDMLDLTRIEAGGLALQMQTVPLHGAAQAALAMVQDLAEKAQVALALEGDAALGVRADPARLHQVLLNLLTNAIKYNRPGGRVALRVWAEGMRVCTEVADTGLGISEAALPVLFEPFQRGDQHRSPIDGAGIGLAVTRALVLAMDGEITVQSRPGAGSVFSVWLPAGSAADHSST
jgi:PAS domain S-box-containing protein